jgi:histidine ammonia-lyase
MTRIELDGETLDPKTLWEFSIEALNPKARLEIRLRPDAQERISRASAWVKKITQGNKPVYGINTGFGKFAEVAINKDQLDQLQTNLILSHACGVGPDLSRDLVMAMWIIRLNTICRGNSGVRPETVNFVIKSLESGILACVPARGSVGASGDLAPSAHATLALIGEGFATIPAGESFTRVLAKDALKKNSLEPLKLGAKEGLSLINGTQTTTALALKTWYEGRVLLHTANIAASLSLEGLRGSHHIVDERVLKSRNQPGAVSCGIEMARALSAETEISKSHENCGKVQDPYSLRCAPQVHGAVFDELERAEGVLRNEINSSTDNPLLFPEDHDSISGGNFHAIYTARTSDCLASALTTLASISERRIALAMSPESSGLLPFLVKEGGLNSGFMMAQVTAAALVSESKSLSFPASVDSIPTSDDREDHVSMGPIAGMKSTQIAENVRRVLAIELLAAAQALDLLNLKSSPALERVRKSLRERVPMLERDRVLSIDIEAVAELIHSKEFVKGVF